jgi:hypothetical protein
MTEQSKIWQVEKAFLPVGLKSPAAILFSKIKHREGVKLRVLKV